MPEWFLRAPVRTRGHRQTLHTALQMCWKDDSLFRWWHFERKYVSSIELLTYWVFECFKAQFRHLHLQKPQQQLQDESNPIHNATIRRASYIIESLHRRTVYFMLLLLGLLFV